MELAVLFMIAMCFSTACALIAQSRGRSAVAWFMIGICSTILVCPGYLLVLVLLFALPNLKVEEAKFARLKEQNTRLRERLKKDRQVADTRHQELSRRVGAHDRALGLDTEERQPILGADSPPELLTEGGGASLSRVEWYYVIEGEAKGPVTLSDLRALAREDLIRENSLIWHEGMSDWQNLRDVPGLSEEIDV